MRSFVVYAARVVVEEGIFAVGLGEGIVILAEALQERIFGNGRLDERRTKVLEAIAERAKWEVGQADEVKAE